MKATKEYILSGNAVLTIEEPNGTKHVFRFLKGGTQRVELFFVEVKADADGEEPRWYFIGVMSTAHQVDTVKSSFDFSIRLLNRVLARIWADEHSEFESKGYKAYPGIGK